MKKVIMLVVLIATVIVSCKKDTKGKVEVQEAKKEVVKTNTNTSTEVANNNIELAISILAWKGTKPGGAHNGNVKLKSGSLIVENGNIKSGEFIIDMTTIKNLDIKDKGKSDYLAQHLSNADFFDVEKYPTSRFVITSSKKDEGKLAVTGNLTIKDVTKSITIPATVSTLNGMTTFKSDKFKVDRSDFNVKHKSKSFFSLKELKDGFIDDLIEFSFVVRAKN